MLAPAIAALVGIGMIALWRDYRQPGWRGWLLPLVLVGMAAVQDHILWDYEGWPLWLTPAISGLCLVAAGVLVVARMRSGPNVRVSSYVVGAATAGVLALLIAPAAWAAHATLLQEVGGPLPAAGPRPAEEEGGPGGGPPPGGGPRGEADPVLVEYLQANKGEATYLVAGPDSRSMSSIILGTDEPVINMGGFMGRDPVFTTDELTSLVDEGAVRFFLVQDRERAEEMRAEREAEREAYGDTYPQGGPPQGGPPGSDNEAVTWVQDNCEKIPQELWRSPEADEEGGGGPGGPGGPRRVQGLHDCGVGRR
jgi:4-amino-4-deoxy-L-arabinose transferase-like glycosyltransferase